MLPDGTHAPELAAAAGSPPAVSPVSWSLHTAYQLGQGYDACINKRTRRCTILHVTHLHEYCMPVFVAIGALIRPLRLRGQRLCKRINGAEARRDGQLREQQRAQYTVAGAGLHGLADKGVPDACKRHTP